MAKRRGKSATARTLEWLRKLGYEAGVVERWLKWGNEEEGRGGNRVDLFGFLDVLAMREGERLVGVQAFTTDWTGHLAKIESAEVAPKVRTWLGTGHARLLLCGWRQLKVKRGGKATRWTPRVLEIHANGSRSEVGM